MFNFNYCLCTFHEELLSYWYLLQSLFLPSTACFSTINSLSRSSTPRAFTAKAHGPCRRMVALCGSHPAAGLSSKMTLCQYLAYGTMMYA